jgi:hypothetical protein
VLCCIIGAYRWGDAGFFGTGFLVPSHFCSDTPKKKSSLTKNLG